MRTWVPDAQSSPALGRIPTEDWEAAESSWETTAPVVVTGRGGSTGGGDTYWPQPALGLCMPPHSALSVLLCEGAAVRDDMNSYVNQYYNGPSSGESVSGAPLSGPTQPLTLRMGTARPGEPLPWCL